MKAYLRQIRRLAAAKRGPRGCAVLLRRFLAGVALLGQFQLVWLGGFHYHPEVSGAPPASSSVTRQSSQPTTPDEHSRSCPFCQVVRDNHSTPPATGFLFCQSFVRRRIAPLILATPLSAPQVRLAGRDPPLSF